MGVRYRTIEAVMNIIKSVKQLVSPSCLSLPQTRWAHICHSRVVRL